MPAARQRSRGCRDERHGRRNDRGPDASIQFHHSRRVREAPAIKEIVHDQDIRFRAVHSSAAPPPVRSCFPASATPARAADITVGIIYVGSRADYGWNQAHAVGAKALKEIPGVKVVEEENVPETVAVQRPWSR